MNEATFQAQTMHAMKFVCRELNKKMDMYVTSSNEQSPVDGEGRPYDVGVLLDNAYLVGIEFKICEDGRFPSWDKDQHETYIGLTGGQHIQLPLYYAYNAVQGAKIGRMYADDEFIPILENSNISLPKDLPGSRPDIMAHENVYNWLLAMLSDSSEVERNGWTAISLKNGWNSGDAGQMAIEGILQGFPDIIWLLVTAYNGARISWALTGEEIEAHVATLRATWKQKKLREVKTPDKKQAYLCLIEENNNYLRSVQAGLINKQADEASMEQEPKSGGSGLKM
jgi:hypothetical protein